MQVFDEALAMVDQARAYQIDDVLLLRAAGSKPTACHVVTLERSLLDVEPPAFTARLSTDPRVRCTRAVASFEVHQAYRIGVSRPQVLLHHDGGELTVDVEDLTPQLASLHPAGVDPPGGGGLLGTLTGDPGEAVGYSRDYDLGDAVRDAITKLPPQGPAIPDWLSTYSVVSIGAEIGGIAGLNHLTVRVRGAA